eukprot:3678013-Amphidinium_carterae.1
MWVATLAAWVLAAKVCFNPPCHCAALVYGAESLGQTHLEVHATGFAAQETNDKSSRCAGQLHSAAD